LFNFVKGVSISLPTSRKRSDPLRKGKRVFRVLRLGITGRFVLFLLMIVLIPMVLTSWMIESEYLMPGKNLYIAVPLFFLFILIPIARLLAHLVINRDLKIINQFCMEIKKGNYAVYFDLGNEGEDDDQFIVLLRNLTWMSHNLKTRQKKNRTRIKKIQTQYFTMEEKARTDELTCLYNRGYFETLLLCKAKEAAAVNEPLSLIFIDCDKFKQVNDTQGHHAGDLLLKQLAESIRSGIRLGSDIPFRFGGDEFAILLPETGKDLAVDVANRIHLLFHDSTVGKTTLSMGVASSRFDEDSAGMKVKELVRAADQQAYRVKKQGGDGTCSVQLMGITEHEKDSASFMTQKALCTASTKKYCKDCLGISIDKSLAGNQIVGFVQALVKQSVDGVLFIDRKGVVKGINPAGLKMLGSAPEAIIGRSWTEFKSRFDRLDCLQNIRLKLLKPSHWRGAVWYDMQDGSRLPLELHVTVVRSSSGSIGGFCVQFRDLIAIKSRDEKLYNLAHYDNLTGLPNRNLFLKKLQQAISSNESKTGKLVVFRLHIENFRHIKEIFYAETGDLLMGQIIERLSTILNRSVTVSKYSGDEFALLIEGLRDVKIVELVTREIVGVFQSDFHVRDHEFFLTVSVGSAVYPHDAKNAEKLMCNAGLAMFQAKQEGKNSSCRYIRKLSDQVHHRYDLCKRLRRALQQDEIAVWYQPQIDVKREVVSAVEALVRWEAEPGKFISPMEFISVAEETGIILELGQHVLREACRQAVSWQEEGIELRMAVNISARQLQQVDFAVSVAEILGKTKMDSEYLELEITETMMMENKDDVAILLWKLKDMGIKIAVDDFGSGYSSLAYLKQFPLGTLKIDRAFVKNLPKNGDDIAITSTIINMAESLGLEVVAEGVETIDQYQFFRERGCDKVQGYLFSKPQPASEMSGLLRKWKDDGISALKSSSTLPLSL
jgi:diguanylate cyclase (GGDEF)-like protein/PAS domain S-box-containing protein